MAKISFQVNLENVDMSTAQQNKLEREINALVGTYLVKFASDEAPLGRKLKPRPEWMGIWIKKFKSIDDFKSNPDFKKFTLKAPE